MTTQLAYCNIAGYCSEGSPRDSGLLFLSTKHTKNTQKEQSSVLSLKTRGRRADFLCCLPAGTVLTFPAGGQAGSNGSLEPFEETGVSNIFAYFVYFVEERVSKSLP
ncbi:MAG: hypothetical protein IJJ26_10645 [Victivallales bacterium]|nr:hypothetical protein [Victivallales bacterium]